MGLENHIDTLTNNKAILNRSSDYRQNGYQTISGSPSKQRPYSNLEQIQATLIARGTRPVPATVPKGSIQHAQRYLFTHGNNYKIGTAPYQNEGHHMLPCEAFTDAYLTSNQLLLLWKVDYDINNGKNIIFLPVSETNCDYHLLPSHCGSHPKYNSLVASDMQAVRDSLQKEIDSDPDHEKWNPPADIPQQLLALQDDYWNVLITCGPVKINTISRRAARRLTSKKAR